MPCNHRHLDQSRVTWQFHSHIPTPHSFNTGYSGCIVGCAATVSRAAVNTTVSAGTSTLTVMLLLLFCGRPGDIAPTLNGMLVGLVSITAACGFVQVCCLHSTMLLYYFYIEHARGF